MSEKAVAPEAFIGVMGVPVIDGVVQLPLVAAAAVQANATDYEECLACQ